MYDLLGQYLVEIQLFDKISSCNMKKKLNIILFILMHVNNGTHLNLSCSSTLSISLAWGSFGTCMGSAVTALNHYTKTIIEFKFKRRTIEKKLRIEQKILELDVPEDLWYITSLQEQADQHAALYVNGSEPSCFNPTILDNWDREYC